MIEAIGDAGMSNGRIGVELGLEQRIGMPVGAYLELVAALPEAEFVDAAEHQAAALGIPDIARDAVYVPHPIQDATDDEMRQKARDAVDQMLESLVRRP